MNQLLCVCRHPKENHYNGVGVCSDRWGQAIDATCGCSSFRPAENHCSGCTEKSWDLPEGRTHQLGTVEHPYNLMAVHAEICQNENCDGEGIEKAQGGHSHAPKPEDSGEKCPHGCPWKHQPEHWHYKKAPQKTLKEVADKFNDTMAKKEQELGLRPAPESWEKRFDELYGDDFEGGFRDTIKDFIQNLLHKAEQEAEHKHANSLCPNCVRIAAAEARKKTIEDFEKIVDAIDASGGGNGRRIKIQLKAKLKELK